MSGAGGRIRTDAGRASGLQDRSNRPLWDTSIFCYIMNDGPSGGAQTHGLMVPNHALYQLSYTRILIMNGMSLA